MALERDDLLYLTDEAQERLDELTIEHREQLLLHSRSVARRLDAPAVSARYIDLAAAELVVRSRTSSAEARSLGLGSLFGGGALSGAITYIATANPPTALGAATAMLFALAAWFLGKWQAMSRN